jgi:hypothetical protein
LEFRKRARHQALFPQRHEALESDSKRLLQPRVGGAIPALLELG